MGLAEAARDMIGRVEIRREQWYAWHGPSLLLTDPRGECGSGPDPTGFYFRETRCLSRLRFEINGVRPWLCAAGNTRQDQLSFAYVHPEMAGGGAGGSGAAGEELPRDGRGLPRRAMDLLATYRVGFCSLEILVVLTNRWAESATIDLAWHLDADYADLLDAHSGDRLVEAPVERDSQKHRLRFRYADRRIPMETMATADGAEWTAGDGGLCTSVALGRGETRRLRLLVSVAGDRDMPDAEASAARARTVERWRARVSRVSTRGELPFGHMVNQAMSDLGSFALLEGRPDEWLAPAAGAPLYPALFGRDSLTATWQATVLDNGDLLNATLTRLRRLQGTAIVPERDEEPGRIIHSVRQGPLARLGKNPLARYYGDFASPLMFVISLAQLYAWTGSAARIGRHWDAARRVLDWARTYGDRDGDGYLEYCTQAAGGPKNQGWKDSGNGIVYRDGRQVPPPIATCEIQGYWFAAQQLAAVLSWVLGYRDDARALWRSALDLKERFNRDWWMPDERFVALALDPDKRQAGSITSNVGHCLASGIIAKEHIRPVVGRLFSRELFSGWGIRTLSSRHPSYNPVSYHLGSVWTVENATIAFGLRRYGFDARTLDLFEAHVRLAMLYPQHRVPECVGGYSRTEFPHPGAYPRANAPQAWNQSAFPLYLQTLLGLQPVAPLHLLAIDPLLPEWLPEITLEGLRLGDTTATLRFRRKESGRVDADVVRQRGPLHLLRQPPVESVEAGLGDRFRALAESILPW